MRLAGTSEAGVCTATHSIAQNTHIHHRHTRITLQPQRALHRQPHNTRSTYTTTSHIHNTPSTQVHTRITHCRPSGPFRFKDGLSIRLRLLVSLSDSPDPFEVQTFLFCFVFKTKGWIWSPHPNLGCGVREKGDSLSCWAGPGRVRGVLPWGESGTAT